MRAGTNSSIAANYGLPYPGKFNSLSVLKTIKISTSPPEVLTVTTSLVNGTYGIGQRIPIFVTFDKAVVVSGSPIINMQTNNPNCYSSSCDDATYVGGSGTATLEFLYVAQFGDDTDMLDYKDTGSLQLLSSWAALVDGGDMYIKAKSTTPETDASLILPPPGLKLTVISPCSLQGCYHSIAVQTEGLGISNVYSDLLDGVYSWGTEINIYVEFTGPIVVTGIPEIALDLPTLGKAKYVSGSGGFLLRFGYICVSTDYTLELTYVDEYSLTLPNGASIVSTANAHRHAVQTLPLKWGVGALNTNNKILIAGAAPHVKNIMVGGGEGCTGDSLTSVEFGVGHTVQVLVEFDQIVRVPVGAPRILMNNNVWAYYASGSQTNTLTFEFSVTDGTDVASLDISNELDAFDITDTMIVANSDAIVVFADILTLPSAGSVGSLSYNCNAAVNTDVVTVTKVEWIQESGAYTAGHELSARITFSKPVQVGGTGITLDLYTGENTIPGVATYLSGGNNEDSIVVKYTVQSLDVSSDLDYTSTSALKVESLAMSATGERLNYIKRFSTNPSHHVDVTLPARGSANSLGMSGRVLLDNSAARVLSVDVNVVSAEYTTGDRFVFDVTFDQTVFVEASALTTTVLYLNSNTNGDLEGAKATLIAASSGTAILQFEYVMGSDDEVALLDFVCTGFCLPGSIGVYEPRPLDVAGHCDIYHVPAGGTDKVCSSVRLPAASAFGKTISVSRYVPVVQSVLFVTPFSPWGHGKGQEIDVEVTFDKAVSVDSTSLPYLEMSVEKDAFGAVSRRANAVYVSGGGSVGANVLLFKYTVDDNHNIDSVEYTGTDALKNTVYRYANSALTIACDLTLAAPYTEGGLGYHRRVATDTSVPFPVAVIPLKKPAAYVTGEVIAFVVRFNLPVVVTGTPRMLLNVDSVTYATYSSSWSEEDANFDVLDTDVIFTYTVQDVHPAVDSLTHSGATAIELNGGTIMRLSTNPSVSADLNLRESTNVDYSGGNVNGQIMTYFPKKVEVLIRDMWHEEARDLEIKLSHGGQELLLVNKVGEVGGPGVLTGVQPYRATFGEASGTTHASMKTAGNLAEGGGEVHMDRHLGGMGYDYLFGDMQDENLALKGTALQSTTKYSGYATRAIDDNVDGYFSRGSVSHTGGHGDDDFNPWWQVRLENQVTIGGIRIFNRQLQPSSDEVQVVTVVAPGKQPFGNYRLHMEIGGQNYTSEYINVDAPAMISDGVDSMQMRLEAMTGLLGTVRVSRTTLVGGGDWKDNWVGYQYSITYTGSPGDMMKVKVKNTNFTVVTDTMVDIATSRHGVKNTYYNYKENGGNDYEYVQELFPFWVMVFDSSCLNPELIAGDFNEVAKKAVWFQEVVARPDDDGGIINLAPNVAGKVVRVMLKNGKYLSLAEVQVFESRLNSMNQMSSGSPVPEKPLTQPYIAEHALNERFKNVQYGGLWSLSIRDLNKYSNSRGVSGGADTGCAGGKCGGIFEEKNGVGKVNDWILMITDHAGVLHRFYSDQLSSVLTLPKFGELFLTETSLEDEGYNYFNGRGAGGKIEEAEGLGRNLGPCYGVDTTGLNGVDSVGSHRYCYTNYGVGGLRSTEKKGATAHTTLLSKERVLVYRPFKDFLGVDHFTYQNWLGVDKQEVTEVTVSVKNCRRYEKELTKGLVSNHALCACQRSEDALFGGSTTCPAAVISTCGATTTSKEMFPFMCSMCEGSVVSGYSAGCKVEIAKAVALLESKGMCDSAVGEGGYPSCREESTSAYEREPFILYGVGTDYFRGGRGTSKIHMPMDRIK
jgi:hypothetical protein